MMSADIAINLTPEYKWGRFFRATAPFDSAMRNSGLAYEALTGNHHDLFIVMIESWGQLADTSYHDLIVSPLMRESIRQRYTMKRGLSEYYGSTTSAEFRELCDRWAEFGDYTEVAASFTEHDMDVVFTHADRILVLNRGVLIAEGSGPQIRANPLVQEVYLGGGTVFAGHADA
jgi:hypothetical protein